MTEHTTLPMAAPELTDAQFKALRTVLAIIVLADGRIVENEVVAFVSRLHHVIGDRLDPTRETRWLLDNTAAIRARMRSPSATNWLTEQVEILKSSAQSKNLISACWSVAVSDGELHKAETVVLDFAFSRWGMAA